ncbi:hypothetical protein [Sandarakinorhabdus sp. DWP1-3-1]|uniref:hypothetical protein n=1 Tax=Sandarakinorhabdus sp. DWP1-3-1 TaxID=2804627 RepID=UPI003CFAD428
MNIVEVIEVEPVARPSLALRLRRNWLFPVAGFAVGLVVALLYLNFATYEYAASYRVTPVRSDGPGLSSSLSSLAAVAGVSVGRGDAAKPFTLYLNLLKSRDVAAVLARDRSLMRGIFKRSWDARNRVWRQPPSKTRWLKNAVRRFAGAPIPMWTPPDAAQLQMFLQDNVSVSDDQRNAIATISIANEDPKLAVALLSALDKQADKLVRDRALARAQAAIDYLKRTLPTVVLAEHRSELAESLGEQERVKMMTMASSAFSAEPLGAVIASPDPVTPNPFLTLAVLAALGAMAGTLLAFNRRSRLV